MEAIAIIVVMFILFSGSRKKTKGPRSGGPIIGTGRSPVFYDIMEEEMAPLKEKLKEDAKNGVIYNKETKTLEQLLNGEKGKEFEQSAEDALKEFEEWESRGYM